MTTVADGATGERTGASGEEPRSEVAGSPTQRASHSEAQRIVLQAVLEQRERELRELQAVLAQHERERAALQALVERHVAERTAQLVESNEQIAREFELRSKMELELRQAQRLEAIGRLAAGVAHEINTPIQFVSDSLEFIRDGIRELLPVLEICGDVIDRVAASEPACEPARAALIAADLPYMRAQLPRAIERAHNGLNRVTVIVRSLKSFAHPSRDEMAPVDLNEALSTTLTIAHSEYKYVAELETVFGELPPVTCHVGDFNQVVINLIVNAAHAIADVVGTSGQMGRITIKTWCDGPDVLITIKDTGGGIPEYVRDYIFEPFFTTKEMGKGTGQGLAIARAVIVEKHRGSLTFESNIGEGTTFLIRMPITGSDVHVASAE